MNALATYFIFDFRDNVTSKDPDVEYRRKEFDDIFKRLETAGKQYIGAEMVFIDDCVTSEN